MKAARRAGRAAGFAALLACGLAAAQEPAAPPTTAGGRPAASERTAAGDEVVRQAARAVAAQPSLEAKLRQQVDLHGQKLTGVGAYHQLVAGPDLLVRMELRTQIGEQSASLLQVCDGRFLWLRRDVLGQASLSRVDVRRVREALAHAPPAAGLELTGEWLALGGLPQLLQRLGEHFAFEAPQSAKLGALPVWTVRGAWRPEVLAKMFPQHAEAIQAGRPLPLETLPPQTPDVVELALGADDTLPLFPYRIQFLRREAAAVGPGEALVQGLAADGAGQGEAEELRPLVTLELYEVRRRADLDPRVFAYQPGDQEVVDHTRMFLERLGAAKVGSGVRR